MMKNKTFKTFQEFYPFYLSQHKNKYCRRLHIIGLFLSLCVFILSFLLLQFWLIFLAIFMGYAFAWVGHFFFEKNKPATFQYPIYSFIGDWVMVKDILTGKIRF